MTAVIAGVVALAAVALSAWSIYWTRRLHRARLEAYRRARARLLAGSPPCVHCGRPATEADHQPPPRITPLRARQLDDVIAHDTIDPRRRR